MIGKRVLNGFLGLFEGIASLLGYKLRIRLDMHKIYLDFIHPDKRKTREYNEDHFVNGNIYKKGTSTPIKPKMIESNTSDVISSDRYKDYMGLSLARDLVNAQKDEGWSTRKILLMSVVLSVMNIGIVLFILMLFAGGGA